MGFSTKNVKKGELSTYQQYLTCTVDMYNWLVTMDQHIWGESCDYKKQFGSPNEKIKHFDIILLFSRILLSWFSCQGLANNPTKNT